MHTSSKNKVLSKRVSSKQQRKMSKGGELTYDLCLDRRVASRRDSLMPSLESIGPFDSRHTEDRRMDKRPLSDFPYLPEVVI
jgi:hypothetical protein